MSEFGAVPGGFTDKQAVGAKPGAAAGADPGKAGGAWSSLVGRLSAPLRPRPWRPGDDPRAVRHPAPTPVTGEQRRRIDRVAVVGGGIAGLAAAVALAERGVEVVVYERERQLGGRVGSWPVDVPTVRDKTPTGRGPSQAGGPGEAAGDASPRQTMSRGFHAFFRQYYNLRALLRRTDPALSHLIPLEDYPLRDASGNQDTFTGLPKTPPWSVFTFALRSPSFPLAEVARVDIGRALRLLDVRFPETFSDYDGVSAAEVLDRLRFPPRARHLALEVFARSFFADPREFSGGELVGMFHAYFMGSAEGLVFDVPDGDYDRVLWAPLGRHLAGLGARVHTGASVEALWEAADGRIGVRVAGDSGDSGVADAEYDAVVLATDLAPLQRLVEQTPWLGAGGQDKAGDPAYNDSAHWRERVLALRRSPSFAVWRLWFDRPVAAGTPPFLGTAGLGRLDNVSVVNFFEEEARAWAARTGGSVVELHGYALEASASDEEVRADLRAQLDALHPELVGAAVVSEQWLRLDDCPLVTPHVWRERPGVSTPDPRVLLAGDFVRCDWPIALMERAATTGFQAANTLLAASGRPGHELWSVPLTGRLGAAGPLLTAAADRLASTLARRP